MNAEISPTQAYPSVTLSIALIPVKSPIAKSLGLTVGNLGKVIKFNS